MEEDSQSSFDGIKVDFDDDISLAQSETSFQIPDQGGGTDSTTSPSLINTRSATLLEKGPNSCHNTSNWVLGVRHLSLSSNRLNERMANRAFNSMNFPNYNKFSRNDIKHDFNNVHNRYFGGHLSKAIPISIAIPMDEIEEVSADDFDTYHSHRVNSNFYQMNGIKKMKEKRQYVTPANQVFNSELIDNQNCVKYVCQPKNHKITEDLNVKILSTKSAVKNDFTNQENGCQKTNVVSGKSGNRTKSCQKTHPQHQTIPTNFNQKALPIKIQSCQQNQISNKLSTNYKRSVNLTTLSTQQQLERYRRQWLCESVSLIIIIIGIILVTITPFLLIPIWVIPNEYSPLIRNILWLSLLTSVILLSLAALTGNIYWYYDEKSQKWKWFYHCGRGPADHYWGATLIHSPKPLNVKNETNIALNV